MNMIRKSTAFRAMTLLLAVILICPINVYAAEPRASYYLSAYSAYCYAAGDGTVQVWFTVEGTDYMKDIGSLSIQVYQCSTNSSNDKDWDFLTSFNNGTTSSMLGHDDYYYSSHVSCNGTAGKWYKAYVCIYAGDGSNGDTRYFWTSAIKAT